MLRQLTAALSASLFAATVVCAQTRPDKPHVDDDALRYFASLGQKERVLAEAQRLTRLDPAWRPPSDLYSARPGRADEGPLWTLYAEGRLEAIEQAIALRKAAEPGWAPSEDLQAKIKAKLLRAKVLALAKAGAWREIVHTFKESGIAWAKDDAELLWVIAEAYARENDCGEAYIVYRSILVDHADPSERRATIEHAIALLPMAMTEKLIAMGHADAAGHDEFAPIAIDITRARISAYLHDERPNEIATEELTTFQAVVHDSADPNEPGLVAWYDFKRAAYPEALEWFKLAISRGGDAMIAHGLAHTLRKLDRKREAEEVAYAWRERLVNNSILFIDLLETDFTQERPPFIEAERVARYAKVTADTESGEGAQALAWYAYNTCQYPLALQWFERANAWLPKEATVYGYALALQRLRRAAAFRDTVNRYDGLFPKVVALAFDDGTRRPPPPCEANPGTPSAPPIASSLLSGASGPDWTGRTMADTLRPAAAATARDTRASFARARVPSPDALAGGADGTLPPLVKRTEFPVAVSPENNLRFSSLRTVATDAAARVRGHEAGPLVARRVPGVGAMPYERYGFTLLKGWDGTVEASSPTSAERPTPAGTLWALEQSLRDPGRHQTGPKTDGPSREPVRKAGDDTMQNSTGGHDHASPAT